MLTSSVYQLSRKPNKWNRVGDVINSSSSLHSFCIDACRIFKCALENVSVPITKTNKRSLLHLLISLVVEATVSRRIGEAINLTTCLFSPGLLECRMHVSDSFIVDVICLCPVTIVYSHLQAKQCC